MEIKKYPFGNNWTEQQYFKYACFCDDLQLFYRQWIEQKQDRIQFFDISLDGKYKHRYWIPSKICSYSDELLNEENLVIKIGYWTPFCWTLVKNTLLNEAKTLETLFCQTVDCSCNDCKFFERKDQNNGLCNKKENIFVKAYPNMAQPNNLECFEHRKGFKLLPIKPFKLTDY